MGNFFYTADVVLSGFCMGLLYRRPLSLRDGFKKGSTILADLINWFIGLYALFTKPEALILKNQFNKIVRFIRSTDSQLAI